MAEEELRAKEAQIQAREEEAQRLKEELEEANRNIERKQLELVEVQQTATAPPPAQVYIQENNEHGDYDDAGQEYSGEWQHT